MKNRCIFIVGIGRSGTSLLQSMLASHSEISHIPETSFFRRYVAKGKLHKIYKKIGEYGVLRILRNDYRINHIDFNIKQILKTDIKSNGILDEKLYNALLDKYNCSNKRYIVDKDPRCIEYLPVLERALPFSKIINIYRDPRDVLVSKKKAAWSKKGIIWRHIFANRIQFKIWLYHKKKSNKNIHEICYEQLISSPKIVLSNLCSMLDISFEERMLYFNKAAKKLVTKREKSWKKETLGPLLSYNKNKWKYNLPYREVVLTELCCREVMRLGGYKFNRRKEKLALIDYIWIILGWITIMMATFPYLFYQNILIRRAVKRFQ